MDCIKAREIIYLTHEAEFFSAELIEAKEHLKNCSSCTEFFKEEEILKNIVHEMAPREKAPQSLRQLALGITAVSRSSSMGAGGSARYSRRSGMIPKFVFALLFLILMISVLVLYKVSFEKRSDSLASLLIEDHIKNVPGDVQILSSDPATVKEWFRGKVDFVVNVPKLRGITFIGGRLCQIEGKRLALLFYEKDGKPLSVFVMDESLIGLNWKDKNVIGNDKTFSRIMNERGCNIIFWREKGIIFAIVSDIDKPELMEIVSSKTI